MWRGRLLSQQQQQHIDTHTHQHTHTNNNHLWIGSFNKTPACWSATFPPSTPDVFTVLLTFLILSSCLPANEFLYLTVSNWHSNFPTSQPPPSSILHPPPRLLSLVSFLHFADLGQTPHILCRRRRGGWGWWWWGGGFFVQITWPLYLISLLSKGSGSLQTAPFNFHHSSAGKPHKEGGTCKMSVSIRCSNWTQAAQTVPAVGWLRHAVLSLALSLPLPLLTSTSWTFSSPAAPPLRPTVSSRPFPPPPRPLSCCRHTDRQKHPRHSIIPQLTLRTPATATTMFCLDIFCFLCKSRWDG